VCVLCVINLLMISSELLLRSGFGSYIQLCTVNYLYSRFVWHKALICSQVTKSSIWFALLDLNPLLISLRSGFENMILNTICKCSQRFLLKALSLWTAITELSVVMPSPIPTVFFFGTGDIECSLVLSEFVQNFHQVLIAVAIISVSLICMCALGNWS